MPDVGLGLFSRIIISRVVYHGALRFIIIIIVIGTLGGMCGREAIAGLCKMANFVCFYACPSRVPRYMLGQRGLGGEAEGCMSSHCFLWVAGWFGIYGVRFV
jgi:hypothetical protein